MYSVYKHTCPNGKVYIGITSLKPHQRWGRNGLLYKNQVFYSAIQKYGWTNITHEILLENLTKEEAEQAEIRLIKLYDSRNPKRGYNVEDGGYTHVHSEAVRKKMSKTRKGRSPSEQHRRALSKALTGKQMSPSHIEHLRESHIGYVMPEEQKKKISDSCKGKGTKAVDQLTMDGEYIRTFESIKEAMCAVNGKSSGNITQCCKGKKNHVYGFKWRYSQKKVG